MTHPTRTLTAHDLLSIDVEAEIKKLCGRQLDSPAERLVELARLAIQSGGRAVRVDVRRRRSPSSATRRGHHTIATRRSWPSRRRMPSAC